MDSYISVSRVPEELYIIVKNGKRKILFIMKYFKLIEFNG